MKNRGACFSCSNFLHFKFAVEPFLHLQDLDSMHIYISSQTLSRTSGTNVAAKALTALIAFKHTFILIIHLFSGIWDFALCTRLSSKKAAN